MYTLRPLALLLLVFPVGGFASTPISCKQSQPDTNITSIWPAPYFANAAELCFDVKGWPEYSGKNCVKNGGEARWTGLVIVTEDGESQGRDSTKFRVVKPTINDTQIKYTIEWSRGEGWRPMQKVTINRLTGEAVSYFVTMHGGESYQCQLAKKAI